MELSFVIILFFGSFKALIIIIAPAREPFLSGKNPKLSFSKSNADFKNRFCSTFTRSVESKYFKSFSGLLIYTFEGKNVTYSVLGLNKIKIFYKNASNQEVELTPTEPSYVVTMRYDRAPS